MADEERETKPFKFVTAGTAVSLPLSHPPAGRSEALRASDNPVLRSLGAGERQYIIHHITSTLSFHTNNRAATPQISQASQLTVISCRFRRPFPQPEPDQARPSPLPSASAAVLSSVIRFG
jgi:hypothetical protein